MVPSSHPTAISSVHEGQARPTVELHLPDGRVLEGPRGAPLEEFVRVLDDYPELIVGAVVNGDLRELTYPVEMEAKLRPVTLGEPDGMRIYRRSLTFLLAAAFEELFPGAWLTVDHSVSSGGYFCQVRGRPQLTGPELELVEGRMRQLAEADGPAMRTTRISSWRRAISPAMEEMCCSCSASETRTTCDPFPAWMASLSAPA